MCKKYCILLAIIILGVLTLTACHKKNKSMHAGAMHFIIVKNTKPTQRLYYSGTLAPLNTVAVVSQMAGNVSHMNFTYGEKIKAGQILLIIDSKPLSHQYRKVVNDFLQKKQHYENTQFTFDGTKALYKAGVIPEDTYISGKTSYDTAVLDYMQAQYALRKVLKTVHVDPKTVESLSLDNTHRVNALLQRHFRHVVVTAPASGVALYPLSTQRHATTNQSGKLVVGSAIKEGQLLLSIGDLSGLSATFNVSEVDVNRIKTSMPVIVTGTAFPGAILHGVVTAVSAQANQQASGSGLSMFTVNIKIPVIPRSVEALIRVGMSAKFEIDIQDASHIMLPINAVVEKNGQSYVTVMNKQGVKKIVPVVTGDTTPTRVVIISGIHVGDKVVLHD